MDGSDEHLRRNTSHFEPPDGNENRIISHVLLSLEIRFPVGVPPLALMRWLQCVLNCASDLLDFVRPLGFPDEVKPVGLGVAGRDASSSGSAQLLG